MEKSVEVDSPAKSNDNETLMYSHYSLVRELAINVYKPKGIANNL